jgi:hypothetical protein
MTMANKPYTPTRTCPHRWCRPMHLAPVPFCLAVAAFYMWNNWLWLLMLAFAMLFNSWMTRIIHFRPRTRSRPATFREVVQDVRSSPTPIDLEMEDAKYEGTGWRMLQVRKWWARIAVGCDILLVLNVGLAAVSIFSSPHKMAVEVHDGTASSETVWSVLVGFAFMSFSMYAHKKATQPRKPKRAWMPVFLRTNV